MTKIEKIKDFIQSFLYYPKMVKWYESEDLLKLDIWGSAFKYALWHCKIGKLKPNYEVDDSYDEWRKDDWLKPVYRERADRASRIRKLENGKLPSSGIYIPHHEGTEYIGNEQYNNSWVRDNGYRYMVTKYGTPIMLCRNEEDALEIANNTENYGLGLSVTDLEKI